MMSTPTLVIIGSSVCAAHSPVESTGPKSGSPPASNLTAPLVDVAPVDTSPPVGAASLVPVADAADVVPVADAAAVAASDADSRPPPP